MVYKARYVLCIKCKGSFVSSRIKVHERKCDGILKVKKNSSYKSTDTYLQCDEKFKCIICNELFNSKKAVTSHYWKCHTEKGLKHKAFGKGSGKGCTVAWNKGLTKETDIRVRKNSESVSKSLQKKIKEGTFHIVPMCEEARKKLSIEQSLKNRGGKSKWFDVNGIKVQGTWEFNIALKFEELNIKWSKPKTNNDVWLYEKDGKLKSYSPDFYLPEFDVYIEIKGYWWGDDKNKMDIIKRTYPDRKILIVEKNEYLQCLEV